MIKVVNKHTHKPTKNDIYIGRGSSLGNKWSSKESSKDYVVKTDSREESVRKYKNWFLKKVSEREKKVMESLRKILKREQETGEVNLVCYCKPKLCHGDVIKSFLERIKSKIK